jgi:cytochrome b
MTRAQIAVWDPLVRVGHWIIVFAFVLAFFTEDFLRAHVWTGYVVGLVVAFRVLWGFIGPQHARFVDFIFSPADVLAHLGDLARLHAKRHIGHSPAGGAMVIALLVCLAGTVITGMALYGAKDKAGPLGPLYASVATIGSAAAAPALAEEERGGDRAEGGREGGPLKQYHEAFAYFTLVLAVIHVAGVLWASFVYRENLILAMITGRKRSDEIAAE